MDPSPFLLLPGAGGDSWYWHLVASRLRAHGHEVIAPDLPGDDDAAELDDYVDLALAAAGDRTGLVVVGQSMGALTATLLCTRADVRLLVLVAPMIPVLGETGGGWWSSSGQLAAQRELDVREGRDPDAPFDPDTIFLHDLPAETRQAALARDEREQSGTPFTTPWPLDAWPDVPTRVVAGRHDRLFPLGFVQRLARERIGVEADVVDSGHLPALARPHELADLLRSYVS